MLSRCSLCIRDSEPQSVRTHGLRSDLRHAPAKSAHSVRDGSPQSTPLYPRRVSSKPATGSVRTPLAAAAPSAPVAAPPAGLRSTTRCAIGVVVGRSGILASSRRRDLERMQRACDDWGDTATRRRRQRAPVDSPADPP